MGEFDVVVAGAGPAGCTVALNLAPFWRVAVIDCRDLSRERVRVGECLAPAAKRLLRDMGLLDRFLAEGHLPYYGHRSVWGGSQVAEADGLRDTDGHGWLLDRQRFEFWLREIAVERGAVVQTPMRIGSIDRCSTDKWRIASSQGTLKCRVLVDATGRNACIARWMGAVVQSNEPRLIAIWVRGNVREETAATAGFTFVEAVEDGWWYTVPVPEGRRIVAFHVDAGSNAARTLRTSANLMTASQSAGGISAVLHDCGFNAGEDEFYMAVASGGMLAPAAGDGWFAAGDAAVHFDPLSSQGLLNSLFTGLACAESSDRVLRQDETGDAVETYRDAIRSIYATYCANRAALYGNERRWPQAEFWERRYADFP